jgi:8-oxo-dGTP diphosphatase
VALRYTISTLLYVFNERDEVLLMLRKQEPNLGLWSPCGGKLDMASGESPYACACREANEEIGFAIRPGDLHLTGVVCEQAYHGEAHWLMFLFEVFPRLSSLPPDHREGCFGFFPKPALASLPLPRTDADQIWPLFWQHRGGYFAARCRSNSQGGYDWCVEESRLSGAVRAC